MTVYRNKKTGVEFFSPCVCKGADIESVPASHAPDEDQSTVPAKKPGKKPGKKTSEK